MDGTCLTSRKRITDSTLSALSYAAARSVEIVPTTGRVLTCRAHQLVGCRFFRYVISANGARVTDTRTGETLHASLLPRDRGLMIQPATAPACNLSFSGRYVEISDSGATKGAVLTMLVKQLGIAWEDIACIGDSANDLTMFDSAGLRFAVGNAVPELKARADVVLPDNDQEGVALAIRRHLLSGGDPDKQA